MKETPGENGAASGLAASIAGLKGSGLLVSALLVGLSFARCTFAPDLSRHPPCETQEDCSENFLCAAELGVCLSRCGDDPCPPLPEEEAPPILGVHGLSERDGRPFLSGIEAMAFEAILSASKGEPPYVFSLSAGELPPGVVLTSAGRIVGTPELPGSWLFELTVSDASASRKSRKLSATFEILPLLRIGTLGIAEAEVDRPYLDALYATGGVPPYQWALRPDAGSLPPGISLQSDGGVRGIPTAIGTSSFAVVVQDSALQARAAELVLSVGSPAIVVGFATPSLAEGRRGWSYAQRIVARGGQGPYTFALADGGLPPGIELDPLTGGLSGMPTAPGDFNLLLQTMDNTGFSATRAYTLHVH